MAEIGKLLGVRTPVMDALITLASTALGVDFRLEGLTLAKMGLDGIAPEAIAGTSSPMDFRRFLCASDFALTGFIRFKR